jgi:DNA-binding winged helix-turn-helix (wHTH) protein
LIQNPRLVISRDQLLNEVWGYENYPCTRTVDNNILRLRQKLEQHPSQPIHFVTVHGAGYKFLPQDRHCESHFHHHFDQSTLRGSFARWPRSGDKWIPAKKALVR